MSNRVELAELRGEDILRVGARERGGRVALACGGKMGCPLPFKCLPPRYCESAFWIVRYASSTLQKPANNP